jgi:hypothetical protein
VKIEIRNLGAIEQAEINLKPLTIFVGPNNTGKTWTAYVLAGIFGRPGWEEYRKAYTLGETPETYPPLDTAIQQVLDEGNAKIDLVQFADEFGQTYINGIAHLARRWMRKFMGTERTSFENLEIFISLTSTKKQFLKRVKIKPTEGQFPVGGQKEGAILNALKEPGEPTLYFYTTAEGSVLEKLPFRAIKEFLAGGIFLDLQQAFYHQVYIFPVERTITVTFTPVEPVAQRIIDQTTPMGHFLELIRDAFRSSQSARGEQAKNDPAIRTYIQLAQLLKEEILGGNVDFSTPEPKLGRELLFQPADGITLEMPIVSSMVKELSPLVLYLRYLAQPGELLIIDEPEMNLHPEAQARLAEFLAMLVNAGLHVLFTTHSPYMVDHLANLIKAAEHENKEEVKKLFYLQRPEAFISKEKVSIYLFENGTTKHILTEEGLIDWSTFGNVSDRVSRIYFDL